MFFFKHATHILTANGHSSKHAILRPSLILGRVAVNYKPNSRELLCIIINWDGCSCLQASSGIVSQKMEIFMAHILTYDLISTALYSSKPCPIFKQVIRGKSTEQLSLRDCTQTPFTSCMSYATKCTTHSSNPLLSFHNPNAIFLYKFIAHILTFNVTLSTISSTFKPFC